MFVDFLNVQINKNNIFNSKLKLTIKGYDKINSPYVADHIYYSSKMNNNIFPIELQIWDSKSMELNEKSHEE